MIGNRSNLRYDKNVVKKHAADLASHYLGQGKLEGGSRMLWRCPACEKEGKLSMRVEDNVFGCLVAGCELGGSADIITFVAYMENLHPKAEFLKTLARAYDVLGLDGARRGSGSAPREKKSASSALAAVKSSKNSPPSIKEREEMYELCDKVFTRIMEISKLEARDRTYLRKRGLSHETISEGRFGSMSHERARYLLQMLEKEYGEEELLRVPGFFINARKEKLGFTLAGDYLLIPYLNRKGRISNIEGRRTGESPKGMGKYVSLRNSGNHLYVFPPCVSEPEKIEAFTEGCFGAIVAAQSGMRVGSIQGCKRFKATTSSSSPFAKRGEDENSLHELAGVNFGGRTIPYIPDADDPPNEDVLESAPEAAHHLISRHGGRALLCSLPRGLDLDEWLLSIPTEERRNAFANLLAGAVPLRRSEEWKRSQLRPRAGKKQNNQRRKKRLSVSKKSGEEPSTSSADEDTAAPDANENNGEEEETDGREPDGTRDFRHEVYSTLVEKAPLKDEHKKALSKIGLLEKAMSVGMLGSLDPDGAERIASELDERFGSKKLLTVPGFETDTAKNTSVRLPGEGEYILLPCLDGDAFITGIATIAFDADRGEILKPDAAVPFPGSGNLLYVFAVYSLEEIEGFCDSPVAAILAAQSNVVLGAVVLDDHRVFEEDATVDSEQPLSAFPELEGVDFGERRIPCVPQSEETRVAIRRLIVRHNGKPKRVSAPMADGSRISLLEYILAVPEDSRDEKLREMFPETTVHDRSGREGFRPPSALEILVVASVAVVVFAAFHVSIQRLEAFGWYVGIGYGGQPFVESGIVGFLRGAARSTHLEALYAHSMMVSAVCGLSVAGAVFLLRRSTLERRRRYAALASFGESEEWRAHLIEEEKSPNAIVRPAELLEAAIAGAVACLLLRLLGALLMELRDALSFVGIEVGVLVAESDMAAFYGALAFGLFVLWRRISVRRLRLRIARGQV